MSGLDRLRVPDNKRWLLNVMIAVLTALALLVSAEWWVGSSGRFTIAAVLACLGAWVVSALGIRKFFGRGSPE